MKTAQLYKKLKTEFKKFLKTNNINKIIIGLSGGLDSAVSAVLSAETLGAENVFLFALPTKYNAKESMSSAKKLARNLGSKFQVIDINKIVEAEIAALKKAGYKKLKSLTQQNLQPRVRANLLMALSSELGGVVICNGNKSEIYAGYCTLYGDTAGAAAVLGDLYKTEIFELAEYINKDKEIIPWFIVRRPPSAELKHGQKDEDDLPPYTVLDKVLHAVYDKKMSVKKAAVHAGVSESKVKEIMNRVERNKFKRQQMPPVLKIKK